MTRDRSRAPIPRRRPERAPRDERARVRHQPGSVSHLVRRTDIELRHRVILSGRRRKKTPADERQSCRRILAPVNILSAIMFRDGQYLEVIKVPRATAVNSWLSNVRARAHTRFIGRAYEFVKCICEDGITAVSFEMYSVLTILVNIFDH